MLASRADPSGPVDSLRKLLTILSESPGAHELIPPHPEFHHKRELFSHII
ncbi:hypothetical protein SAMD00023353_7000370 [Rosellinia necatrix]|uniref:Uncharacterized protein n=1 Tax=Rosellinia necatrix TaxID=77044 RepID=A0A1S8AAF9_ROSNE|nr:hypothetical protein SAMD00023353_7000370 [Rosellinia necatrix]